MLRSLDAGDEPFMLSQEAKYAFITGMKYADTIRFHSDKELNVEEKKKHLVSIMDSERLSTVSSICLDSKNKIAYAVKKNK